MGEPQADTEPSETFTVTLYEPADWDADPRR